MTLDPTYIYEPRGEFQKQLYRRLSEWNARRIAGKPDRPVELKAHDFGSENGQPYAHLLNFHDAARGKNFLSCGEISIFKNVLKRAASGKGVDLYRTLGNTASSQACCFNLFVPFQSYKRLANEVFSSLLRKRIRVLALEIEFTPERSSYPPKDESLGDQGLVEGTDSDLAIFYETEDGHSRGVWLVEFKLTEHRFSTCGRFRKAAQHYTCDQHLPGKVGCCYHKYNYWQFTEAGTLFKTDAIRSETFCPFQFSANQLWRNLLLAERVAQIRGLDEFYFGVIAPYHNELLWKDAIDRISPFLTVGDRFFNVLSEAASTLCMHISLEEIIIAIKERTQENELVQAWIDAFEDKYLPCLN